MDRSARKVVQFSVHQKGRGEGRLTLPARRVASALAYSRTDRREHFLAAGPFGAGSSGTLSSGGLPLDRTLRLVIVVVLVLRLIGLLPTWPYSPGWGYYPSGGLGLLLLIVVIVLLLGGGKGRPG